MCGLDVELEWLQYLAEKNWSEAKGWWGLKGGRRGSAKAEILSWGPCTHTKRSEIRECELLNFWTTASSTPSQARRSHEVR